MGVVSVNQTQNTDQDAASQNNFADSSGDLEDNFADFDQNDAASTSSDLFACGSQEKNGEECATNSVAPYEDTLRGLDVDPNAPLSGVTNLLNSGSMGEVSPMISDFSTDDAARLYGLRYIVHMADGDRSVHTFHASVLPRSCMAAPNLSQNQTNTTRPTDTSSKPQLGISRVNKLSVLGNVDDMATSLNGQHLFITMTIER